MSSCTKNEVCGQIAVSLYDQVTGYLVLPILPRKECKPIRVIYKTNRFCKNKKIIEYEDEISKKVVASLWDEEYAQLDKLQTEISKELRKCYCEIVKTGNAFSIKNLMGD